MALRAMYKGFKKVLAPLIVNRPGELAIDQDALNTELNTVFFPRSEQLISGVGNYLPRYHDTDTINGVTYTVGSDDVVTVANTATGYSDFTFTRRADKVFRLPVGDWKIIPHKTGTDESYINIGSGTNEDGTGGTFESWAATNGDVVTFTIDEAKSKRYISLSIAIAQNKTANSTWQPMIVPATAPDDTPYVSFAMTNQQLTDEVETLNNRVLFKTLTSANDLNDISESGWFSWGSSAPANSPQSVQYACMKSIIETGVQKHIVFFGSDTIYMRQKSGSPAAWSSWYKFQGTIVS